MALEETQPKTGHLQEESDNAVQRAGRDDGQAPVPMGYPQEESGPIGGRSGRDSGFQQVQGKVGYQQEESSPSKGSPSSTPTRVDEVKEI